MRARGRRLPPHTPRQALRDRSHAYPARKASRPPLSRTSPWATTIRSKSQSEDPLETLPRRLPIADQQGIELGRTEAAIAPQELHQQSSGRGRSRPEVEREVAQDERATGAVEEDDLVLVRATAEEDLPHVLAPLVGRFVAEHRREREIGTLALESGSHPEPRLRIDLGNLSGVQVVNAIGSDRVADAAERIELLPQLRIQSDRGVEQKPLAGQPDHGHPRSDRQPVEGLRPLSDPDVLRQRPQRIKARHGRLRCRDRRSGPRPPRPHERRGARVR